MGSLLLSFIVIILLPSTKSSIGVGDRIFMNGCNSNFQTGDDSFQGDCEVEGRVFFGPLSHEDVFFNTSFLKVTTLFRSTAVLTTDGRVFIFGSTENNVMANTTLTEESTAVPQLVYQKGEDDPDLVDLKCAKYDCGVLDSNGTLISWGYNKYGMHNTGDVNEVQIPKVLFTQVQFWGMDSFGTYIVDKDGNFNVCGENHHYKFGDMSRCSATTNNHEFEVKDLELKREIEESGRKLQRFEVFPSNIFFFYDNDVVMAWGLYSRQSLENDDCEIYYPKKFKLVGYNSDIPEGSTLIDISCNHCCFAIYETPQMERNLYSWGCNSDTRLGRITNDLDSGFLPNYSPGKVDTSVVTNDTIIQVSAGIHTSMFLTITGNVYAWGEIGDFGMERPQGGSELNSLTPVRIIQNYSLISFLPKFTVQYSKFSTETNKLDSRFRAVVQSSFECFGVPYTVDEVCSGHGECLNQDFCDCNEDYAGQNCDDYVCYGIDSNSNSVCSGYGICVSVDECVCPGGITKGDECEIPICFGIAGDNESVCSGEGSCTSPNICSCNSGREGDECESNSFVIFIQNFWVFLLVMFLILLAGIAFVMFLIFIFCVIMGVQRQKLTRFNKIDDLDLVLAEQKGDTKNKSLAHLNINHSLFEIKYEEIKVIEKIGAGGSSSVVFRGIWKGKEIAFKCFKTQDLCGTQSQFNDFETEVGILASINHPNVLNFFGATLKPPRVGIIMEYCPNGDIKQYLENNKNEGKIIDIKERLRFMKEIGHALNYIHGINIIHRDLKCENVLLNKSLECKVMDFGLSKVVERISRTKTRCIGL